MAAKAGYELDELRRAYPRVGEVPFTSERKRMTTVHRTPEGRLHAYMKGAPEVVLERCDRIWDRGGPRPLTEDDKARIMRANEEMASQALRVLAVAYKELPEGSRIDESVEEGGFVFLGLMGMIDPPREEAKRALELCKSAGIRTVMITGDHKLTAIAVAREMGMEVDRVLTGADLEKMSDEELSEVVEEVSIYARVSPEHKVKILKALKEKGHVVAMTGDGINDAPALKKADIGVAMGITGTDVSKEASDMILADDNFATIVAAVEEGRRIVDNIKKYLAYLMRCNIAEILVMVVIMFLLGHALKLPPLTAAQILWVNLTTDGLPALALGVDPAEPDVMKRPPRRPEESIFSLDVKLYLSVVPVVITAMLTYVFWVFLPSGEKVARSVFFLTMITIELACALNSRSLTKPIWEVGAFKNKFLWIAVASSLAMSIPLFYVPGLREVFDITPVGPEGWAWAIGLALAIFVGIEIAKWAGEKIAAKKKGSSA